jgi:transcriptional regulator with XRE-family HTH domain
MNKISDRLKEARSQKKWNQAQLALAAGVSPGTIGNIESGTRQAKGSLPQIAKALGVSHDWLANGEGGMLGNPAQDRASDESQGPSSQAALLAMLFDKLPEDLVLRAQVFNWASQSIIDTIQGIEPAQNPTPATPAPAKTQS